MTIGSIFVAFIFLEICNSKVKRSRWEKIQQIFQRWNRICVTISELSSILLWFTLEFILMISYINYRFRWDIRHVISVGKWTVADFVISAGVEIRTKSRYNSLIMQSSSYISRVMEVLLFFFLSLLVLNASKGHFIAAAIFMKVTLGVAIKLKILVNISYVLHIFTLTTLILSSIDVYSIYLYRWPLTDCNAINVGSQALKFLSNLDVFAKSINFA